MTILDRIVADKRQEVTLLPEPDVTVELLCERIAARGGVRGFQQALIEPRFGRLGLIAEIKKASPSAGVICPDFDPVRIARIYEGGGASCLSVLTDEKYFQGSLEFLKAIRQAVNLPLLRKDFVIDARQIVEAVEWGADAILLIAAILDDVALGELHELGASAGLSVLVEVHDEEELERALSIGATLIGVNNRDLRHFTVDLGTTERLAAKLDDMPHRDHLALVAESGIKTREDVDRLAACGVQALLVGESLMRNPMDTPATIAHLVGD
ncbi:MAG: Indole-3-glycerol phosphate synthase [Verrucomicrobia subdivision 3 bacterium]|nr:Indole-3-glycerol phosphate synthase [Limisphaerales bacterium]MCS1417493.1 Indole-3-glycerol phosphate synthase [Limisphaerales bacterium]